MLTSPQWVIGVNLPDAAIVPLIQDNLTIHPDPRAVVHPQIKTIGRCVEFLPTLPARGEVVRRQTGRR